MPKITLSSTEVSREEIERIYRAIADREPTRELLQLVYDAFGSEFDLRPPVAEMRLARLCEHDGVSHG